MQPDISPCELAAHHWLLIDDDEAFRLTLQRALRRHGAQTGIAAHGGEAVNYVRAHASGTTPVTRVVLDLNLEGESGLTILDALMAEQPDLDVLILTGYGSIATAVQAIRRGALNYLCKPVALDALVAAFDEPQDDALELRGQPPSVDELEWEHIQRVLNECGGNISATARALNMHRRTLQRKLQKRSRWRQ